MKTSNVLVGVLAGVATGAIAGLLFAPGKGAETRKKVFKKGEGYVDALNEKINKFSDNISDKYYKAKEDVSDFTEKAEDKSKQVKKDSKAATSF